MLGVAILIIVMSVMNGFRTELTHKILGFNPHINIKTLSKLHKMIIFIKNYKKYQKKIKNY